MTPRASRRRFLQGTAAAAAFAPSSAAVAAESNIYTSLGIRPVINGIGKIRISLYLSLFIGVVNIPLSVFLARNAGMGVSGVIAATLICVLLGSVFAPIQYYKIINKKDRGIWSR